jgi:hypothetical protein
MVADVDTMLGSVTLAVPLRTVQVADSYAPATVASLPMDAVAGEQLLQVTEYPESLQGAAPATMSRSAPASIEVSTMG